MPLYEKSWWKNMFKQEREGKTDILKDLEAIKEYLTEVNDEVQSLLPVLTQLEELEKERQVAKSEIMQINLETQAGVLDRLLERYEFFQNDTDINGLRLKRIANQFLKHAKKAGMKKLIKEKKEDMKWTFDW